MKSLSLVKPGQFEFVDVPEPKQQADETLVKVLGCGVCGSDLHAMTGQQPFFSYPRRLGHELCVEVVEPSAGSNLQPGDRCIVEPYYFCGKCVACRHGKTNSCQNLQVLGIHFDGGHSPFMSVKSDYLHKATGLTVEQAALVEPLAIGHHAFTRAELNAQRTVVIIGLGTIGLSVAMFAKLSGANVALVDIDPEKVKFAESTMQLGKGFLVNEQLTEQLVEYFTEQPQVVIDATGNKHSMDNCFELVSFGGRIVFVGLFPGEVEFDLFKFQQKELDVLASRAALAEDFATVIELIESGQVDPLPLITNRLDFDNLADELPLLPANKGLIKAIINY